MILGTTYIQSQSTPTYRLYSTDYVVGAIGVASIGWGSNPSGTVAYLDSFRYTLDGIVWSDWLSLSRGANLLPLTSLSFPPESTLCIEIRIPCESNTVITGPFFYTNDSPPNFKRVELDKSPWGKFIDLEDSELVNYYCNLLQKCWDRGVVPRYIQRYSENGILNRDFIEFWRSICLYLSVYVVVTRKLSDTFQNKELLLTKLTGREIQLPYPNYLGDLQLYQSHIYREGGYRGGGLVSRPGPSTLGQFQFQFSSSTDNTVGELLRLYNINPDVDEFIFYPHKKQEIGWRIGSSSPLYRGVGKRYGTEKLNQNTILELTTHLSKIDRRLTYQLDFECEAIGGILVRLTTFDINSTPNRLYSSVDGSISHELVIYPYRNGILPYRVMLYPYNSVPSIYSQSQHKQGNDFIFAPDTNYIQIEFFDPISMYPYPPEEISISFSPSYTNFSHGIIHTNNFQTILGYNRNLRYGGNYPIPSLNLPPNETIKVYAYAPVNLINGGVSIGNNFNLQIEVDVVELNSLLSVPYGTLTLSAITHQYQLSSGTLQLVSSTKYNNGVVDGGYLLTLSRVTPSTQLFSELIINTFIFLNYEDPNGNTFSIIGRTTSYFKQDYPNLTTKTPNNFEASSYWGKPTDLSPGFGIINKSTKLVNGIDTPLTTYYDTDGDNTLDTSNSIYGDTIPLSIPYLLPGVKVLLQSNLPTINPNLPVNSTIRFLSI